MNCAGIVAGQRTVSKDRETGALKAHDLAAFTKVIGINLDRFLPDDREMLGRHGGLEPITPDGGRGVIVNTSSVAAEDGQIGQAAYSASKGGVLGLTLPVARDLSGHGIRVVSILPGIFHTPMFDQISEEYRKTLAAAVPFPQRLGNPAEYAALVETICRNDMLNGTGIRLDGAIRMAPKRRNKPQPPRAADALRWRARSMARANPNRVRSARRHHASSGEYPRGGRHSSIPGGGSSSRPRAQPRS